jgi:phosphatidylglycerol---prolipoprotein diacylglyceryl transferase
VLTPKAISPATSRPKWCVDMHGELFELGGQGFPSYFVLIMVGFLCATAMGALWAKRVGQNPDVIVDLGLLALLSGFAGARVLHVFADGYFMDYVHLCTDPARVTWHITESECLSADYAGSWDAVANVCHPVEKNCWAWAQFWNGGFTFYGGLIGATAGAWWLFRRDRFPFWKATDMGAMMVPIGLGYGRLGCLLAGCCFGKTTDSPWALVFPPGSPASDWQAREGMLHSHLQHSLPVHPTQLYEAGGAFGLAALGILYLHRNKRYDGHVFAVFLAGYALLRFAIEFFRSDDRGALGYLSTSQWIAIVMLLCALLLHYKRRATGLEGVASV